jgi:predicted DNA-binding protein
MRLNAAIPVRFSEATFARLKAISERSSLTVSQLIRMATEQYLEQVESSRSVKIDLRDKPRPSASTNPTKPFKSKR